MSSKENKTVLVIDDEENFLAVLAGWLQGAHLHVVQESDFDNAVQTAVKAKPDIIILDIWDDASDEPKGVSVAHKIREHPLLQNVPIVIYTASQRNGLGPIVNREDLKKRSSALEKSDFPRGKEYILTKGQVPPEKLRAEILRILNHNTPL